MRRRAAESARGGFRPRPRAHAAAALLVLLAAGAALGQANRTVEGAVLDAANHPIPQAVVYLKNTQTQSVETYITGQHGRFYFHAVAPNTNFQVYAIYRGHRSKTRTVSAYNTSPVVRVDLTLPLILH